MFLLIAYNAISAGIFWILLMMVLSRDSVDFSTLFYVALGVQLALFLLSVGLGAWALAAVPFVCVWVLRQFCDATWLRAGIAALLFVLLQFGLGFAMAALLQA